MSGCQKKGPITQIEPPEKVKIEVKTLPSDQLKERIVGMAIPAGTHPAWWFVKMRGPVAEVEKALPALNSFLNSIEFDNKKTNPISWQAPADWNEKPKASFLLALFQVGPPHDNVDCSLSFAGGDLFDNINRWRNQIGLDKASSTQIESTIVFRKVGDRTGFFIDIAGPGKAVEAQTPPFVHP